MATTASSIVAATPVVAATGPDIVISELMINPQDVYDSRGEWIELANVGDAPANLAGWTVTDGRRENVTLPDLTVAPGAQVVLARSGDAVANGGAEADWEYGNQIVLYNPMDRLILTDADGVERDRVDWYPTSGIVVPEGRSLTRDPATLTPGRTASWCAATTVMRRGDLGSPGAPNTCDGPSADVVITEILQNPRRTSDFDGEFFEVHNRGSATVDLAGWTIKDDDSDRFTVDASVPVAAGGYAVFGISDDDNGGVDLDVRYGTAMRLHNDADELVLADDRGILVDRVAWDDGRTFPDPNGASMALVDPAADNADGSAWCTSTTPWAYGDLGTPGAPTRCAAIGENPIVVTEVMFDPQTPRRERSAEWFEIVNLGGEPVDLAGWTVTAGDWKVHTIDSLVVEPGAFAVLAASGDAGLNGDIAADHVYGTDLPLYNRAGRLIVKDARGAIVDRVEWEATNGFPMPTGRSITLGSPTSDNALGPNWCVSTSRWADGDFGTPGTLGDCAAPPAAPALQISEIMRNPAAVGDSAGEWFEISNPTDADVDLNGWAIGDDDSDLHLIRRSVVVPAGDRIVLGRSTDTTANGGAPVAYSYGDSIVLSNRADELVLVDQYGQSVDAVRWDSGAAWIRPNGASMARIDGRWCISGPQFGAGDLGTPGAANDCRPLAHANVVISEIHLDSAAVSDTIGEWIELTNAGSSPVDIDGWMLRDDDADRHTIDAGGSWVLAPGESVVLGRETSPSINGGAAVDYSYGTSFPITNTADEITLIDADGVWVDRVDWSSGRRLPASSGVSASLRSLDLDNSVAANWCASVTGFAGADGDLGTPGDANVCEIAPPPPPPPPGERPFTAGFGVLAVGPCDAVVTGSKITIAGGLRSNGDARVDGSQFQIDGVSFAGDGAVSKQIDGSVVQDPTAVSAHVPWTIDSLAAIAAGLHEGGWTIGSDAVTPGVHVVYGDVTISRAAGDLDGVTIAATGTVTIAGDTTLSPASPGLPTVFTTAGDCSTPAISISGNSVTWSGVLAAPVGTVQMSGSKQRGGAVLGAAVRISGSDIAIG